MATVFATSRAYWGCIPVSDQSLAKIPRLFAADNLLHRLGRAAGYSLPAYGDHRESPVGRRLVYLCRDNLVGSHAATRQRDYRPDETGLVTGQGLSEIDP